MNAGVIHSLGTTPPHVAPTALLCTVAAVAAGLLAVLLAGAEMGERLRGVRRSARVFGAAAPKVGDAAESGVRRIRIMRWAVAACSGLGVAVLFGSGLVGLLAGAGAAVGAARALNRRQGGSGSVDGVPVPDAAELPLCADLMAACLAAGATPGEAAGAVGGCLGGVLGEALLRVRAELRLGGEPVACWERFGRLPGCREMGRCLARASTTGTAPVAEMSRLAADCRAAQARSAMARARKAAVLATAPLGVCFLPAFLLVGVAPVVLGLAKTVLGGAMT